MEVLDAMEVKPEVNGRLFWFCLLTSRRRLNFVFHTLSEIDDETLVEYLNMEQPHRENDAQEGRQRMMQNL